MQVPIGWSPDRLNLRWLYAAAFAVWCLAQGLTGLVESPAVLAGFRSLLGIRDSLDICLGFVCFDYFWYVLVTWLPDLLVTVRHLSIVQAGFYASLAFFTFGVSEPIGGWIADTLTRRGWDETRTRKGIVTGAF